MKNLYSTSVPNCGLDNRRELRKHGSSSQVELPGRWVPTLLICLYFLSFWDWDMIDMPSLRWYMVLGMAIFVFLLQKAPLNLRAAQIFWLVYGLIFFGAALAVLRAPDKSLALWNTVGFGINFIIALLLVPTMSTRFTRKILLIFLIIAAFLWVVIIQNLIVTKGFLTYSTLGVSTGSDKNQVGMLFALASTALFYLAGFWKPSKPLSKRRLFSIRLVFGLLGMLFFFYQMLIYARSGILTTIAGMLFALVALLLKNEAKPSAFFRSVFIFLVFIFSVFFLGPKVMAISPSWERLSFQFLERGIGGFDYRTDLLRKGLFLIGQNPFIGVGLGNSKAAISSSYADFPFSLIHNTFLSAWAETGLVGLLAYFIWFLAVLKMLRERFFQLVLTDQIWLVLLLCVFIEMNFKEISSVSLFMLLIFAGINYQLYQSRQVDYAAHLHFITKT